MLSFDQRAQEMGLDISFAYKGLYSYRDVHGIVTYRRLASLQDSPECSTPSHETDGQIVPIFAIYTKPSYETDFKYVGYVSDLYKFMGHEVLNTSIRESITSIGMPVLREQIATDTHIAKMRNDMIIQNGQVSPIAGDIFPTISVSNSYNGSHAALISFGVSMPHGDSIMTFAFKLGEIRQVHIESSRTTVSAGVSSYVQSFSNDILEMIQSSFNKKLSDNDMMAVLDYIETLGKKKREGISKILEELTKSKVGDERELPSAWHLFLAIVRYSSLQPNLNVRRILENAAESVLVIPARMYDVLNQLEQGTATV